MCQIKLHVTAVHGSHSFRQFRVSYGRSNAHMYLPLQNVQRARICFFFTKNGTHPTPRYLFAQQIFCVRLPNLNQLEKVCGCKIFYNKRMDIGKTTIYTISLKSKKCLLASVRTVSFSCGLQFNSCCSFGLRSINIHYNHTVVVISFIYIYLNSIELFFSM